MVKVMAASKIVLQDRQHAPSDLGVLWQGAGTDSERVIEYAGRLCYASTSRQGTAPGFIQQRIKEGHLDVLEHAWASVLLPADEFDPAFWTKFNRYLEIHSDHPDAHLVSANLRVWRELMENGHAWELTGALASIAPSIFQPLVESLRARQQHVEFEINVPPLPSMPSKRAGDATVTFVMANMPTQNLTYGWSMLHHTVATFLIEGVSRALTHQLVRHRLASVSQESQRYVDLEKGQWQAIVPPAIANNVEAMAEFTEFWSVAKDKYARLRDLGIRKEDARFLLPNATETRLLVTMNLIGWRHFCKLRAVDKAAQWEIRAVGMAILEYLADLSPFFADMLEDAEQ
ncbi:MAG: FAD-dependent thymidylate synthase [Vampirovibrionales bacterium]|nr:FAD-dependent thymidylate synthase [Vampirovibrionales bacterium]